MMRAAAVVVCLVGCDARFIDLRSSVAVDLGVDFSTAEGDLSTANDLATVSDLASGVFARGTFKNRAGHSGRGTATLERSGSTVELVFGANFAVTAVPGPVVVLTAREDMGTTIDPSDLQLGALTSATGAQRYVVPGGDGGRRNAFVFCKPFGVEVAKADLEDLP